MPRPGWYSDNLGRDYPLVEGALVHGVPEDLIADAGFAVGPVEGRAVGAEFGYHPAQRSVYLHGLALESSDAVAIVRTTIPLLTAYELVFHLDPDGGDLQRVDGSIRLIGADPVGESEEAAWRLCLQGDDHAPFTGWITFGSIERVVELATDETTFAAGDVAFEPATIVFRPSIAQVLLVNWDRTRFRMPAHCDPDPVEPRAQFVYAGCLTGPIRFSDGFNTQVAVDREGNRVVFNASPGLGRGRPCPSTDIAIYPNEPVPEDWSWRFGGPTCAEVVHSLNGASDAAITLEGADGASVRVDPDDPHALIVDW